MYKILTLPKEWQTILALASLFALRMLGLFMIFPIFAIYANQLNGVTPTLIGIALGIYGLTQAFLQIPFGFASDYLGRKPIIVLGLILFAVGSIIAAVSTTIYGVIIGRGLQGASAIGSVIMALATDLTREELRVRAMAVIGITIGLSFALAMVLGPLLSSVVGIKGIFWGTAVLSFLAIGVLYIFVPAPSVTAPQTREYANPNLRLIPQVLKNPILQQLTFGILILHATLIALFLKIPLIIQTLGFVEREIWHFYVPVFLLSLVFTIPGLLIMEKRAWVKYGMAGAVVFLILSELGIYYSAHSIPVLAICLSIFFTVFNILEASLPALMARFSPKELKGTALGIFSSAQFLGIFLGGAMGGWADAAYGMVGVFSMCVALTVIWLTFILMVNF